MSRENQLVAQEEQNLMDKHGVDSGAIMLLLPENIDNLIEEYEYFKRLQIGVQMNVVYKAQIMQAQCQFLLIDSLKAFGVFDYYYG